MRELVCVSGTEKDKDNGNHKDSTNSISSEGGSSRSAIEFNVNELAVYMPSQPGMYEIVKILQVERVPGSIHLIEFYTAVVEQSYDPSRVGREPQISADSAGTKLIRLQDAISQEYQCGRSVRCRQAHTKSPV